jgi:DNA anti-recombination protein RmuC
MNAFGFFIGRIAWQMGITRERARWNSITRETQQLAETQDMLGKLAWPITKSVDRLSGEFWQLTDLQSQQDLLRQESDQLIQDNHHAQDRLYQELLLHRERETQRARHEDTYARRWEEDANRRQYDFRRKQIAGSEDDLGMLSRSYPDPGMADPMEAFRGAVEHEVGETAGARERD